MNYRTAKMSLSIKMLTGIILAMVVGFVIGGLHDKNLMVGSVILGTIALVCFLLAPASYDVSNGCLTVVLHAGRSNFGKIVGCAKITERLPFTIRLFGNGGLFAGTGIFWNKRDGIFHVYATSARRQDAVLVQTEKYKVLLTPENPQSFMESTKTLEPANPSYSEPATRSPQG
ncbi:MAG: PH domain-containing protein [Verrucomicrobiota bacterium]